MWCAYGMIEIRAAAREVGRRTRKGYAASVRRQSRQRLRYGHRALRKVWDWAQQQSPLRRAGCPQPAGVGTLILLQTILIRALRREDSFSHASRASSLKEGAKALRRGGGVSFLRRGGCP